MKSVLSLLVILGLSSGQYYNRYDSFRPSPVDLLANTQNNYDDYLNDGSSSTEYNFPSFGMNPPPIPVFDKPLFAAAEYPYPAATSGQIDNYNKAIQQAQEEDHQELLDSLQEQSFGRNYVDVKLGRAQNNLQYQYTY
ncbi:PREDICTED: uncharacterized protein LOC108557947 [Nicrophorus vespilloides]|uniref:Uncharacterized protein LOC108557947 n=1 Tax=Nicrophorus vespilloides TaxID=110193 RepID=A0ABM1M6I3_NICVS|nr:PREDICTED: uncharacterized protein LOC108557947 [Nicrophorus vespilloides]